MYQIIANRFRNEQFDPSVIGILLNPLYLIRRGLAVSLKRHAIKLRGGKLLDFGCGSKPYHDFFEVDEYVGVDIETSGHDHKRESIDSFYDGKHLPFSDASFDNIFSSEVLEHVFNASEVLSELHRVLKSGGFLLISTPFAWVEHEKPYDFCRYTSFGVRHILEKSGFEVLSIEKTSSFVEAIFQIWIAYLISVLKTPSFKFNVFLNLVVAPPMTLMALALARVLPQDEDLFLNCVVLARKI